MAFYLRFFALVLFVYAISALPLDGQQEQAQNDLFNVDSVAETDSASNDDLTRNRRHGYGGYGKCD